jgi:hypothetical protein
MCVVQPARLDPRRTGVTKAEMRDVKVSIVNSHTETSRNISESTRVDITSRGRHHKKSQRSRSGETTTHGTGLSQTAQANIKTVN